MIAKQIVHCGMEGLRYCIIALGVLSVMISGVLKMPMLCVSNWDSLVQSLPFVSSELHGSHVCY